MPFLPRFPKRILHFKRPKWHFIQSKISKQLPRFFKNRRGRKIRKKRRLFFETNTHLKLRFKFLADMRKNHKQKVLQNRSLLIWYNHDKRFLRKLIFSGKHHNQSILKMSREYLKNFYNLNQLLFLSKFTSSIFEANKLLQNKKILLNGNIIKKTASLSKFDVIVNKNPNFNYKTMRNKYTSYECSPSFVHADYYGQTLVIFKDLNTLTHQDISFSVNRYINILRI